MPEQDLLRVQRTQIFQLIENYELNPEEFLWDFMSKQTRDLATPILSHTPTRYFFHFDMRYEAHYARFSPGRDKTVEEQYPRTWSNQIDCFIKWLIELRREIEAPDLWGIFEESGPLLEGQNDFENSPLSPEEIENILRA
jgi:hypothetical protein